MVCPNCFNSNVLYMNQTWSKCWTCDHEDLNFNFMECPFKGEGCGHEDGCTKKGTQVKQCGIFPYLKWLSENF